MILSDTPASCAAVYTQSVVQAAPLNVTKESIQTGGKIQGVIVNSACANACTGEQGLKDAYEMRNHAAAKFGLPGSLYSGCIDGCHWRIYEDG